MEERVQIVDANGRPKAEAECINVEDLAIKESDRQRAPSRISLVKRSAGLVVPLARETLIVVS